MLSELNIANFALIDQLRVEFGPGLNVLTGETGAGKSILIDAIGAVLGERTGQELVRSGTTRATVDAVFVLDADTVGGSLSEDGPVALPASGDSNSSAELEASTPGTPMWAEWIDGGQILISREVAVSGRAQARVNGRPVAAGTLRELSRHLVDLHGQHEHQSLLNAERHGAILDGWIGPPALRLREEIAANHRRWTALKAERAALLADERERARRLDLYRFQAAEIDAAKPIPGEEEALESDRVRLAGAERLAAALEEALHLMSGSETAALESLGGATRRLHDAVAIDPDGRPVADAVDAALFGLEEACRDLRRMRDSVEFNPERLNLVQERLDLLHSLRRKYGDSLEEVNAYRDQIASQLDDLEHSEERLAELDSEIASHGSHLRNCCDQLTAVRTAAASCFAPQVMTELADLAMPNARFEVRIEPREPAPSGADAIEFLLSANVGEPVKPLARIASGGEMSRIMLALKSIVAKTDGIPVLIFDEIDAGVGGRTATVLAEKLHSLAAGAQILCVTHLAQIAAAAHHHLAIDKRESQGRTVVSVRLVQGKERILEVARMLGSAESPAALQHAREMLGQAERTGGSSSRSNGCKTMASAGQPSLFGSEPLPAREPVP